MQRSNLSFVQTSTRMHTVRSEGDRRELPVSTASSGRHSILQRKGSPVRCLFSTLTRPRTPPPRLSSGENRVVMFVTFHLTACSELLRSFFFVWPSVGKDCCVQSHSWCFVLYSFSQFLSCNCYFRIIEILLYFLLIFSFFIFIFYVILFYIYVYL